MVDLSVESKARVWLGMLAGTLLCVAVALLVDSFNFSNLNEDELYRAIAVDVGLPIILAGPFLFLLLNKIRQLALAHAEMARLASTDSLTDVLNRGAFNFLVETYLDRLPRAAVDNGSLLIIDADHFKSINDSLGHQEGDNALKLIALTIQKALRPSDLLGRLGGEEFGVFLPGATRPQAMQIAERIRARIEGTPFPSPTVACCP